MIYLQVRIQPYPPRSPPIVRLLAPNATNQYEECASARSNESNDQWYAPIRGILMFLNKTVFTCTR